MHFHLRGFVFILFFGFFAVTGCFRQEIITVDIQVPQMRSEDCQRLVMRALGSLGQEAIVRAEFNYQEGIVHVTYDSTHVQLKNIEYALRSAGFSANDAEATEESQRNLPPGCR
jgi:copper chaperone CopZ